MKLKSRKPDNHLIIYIDYPLSSNEMNSIIGGRSFLGPRKDREIDMEEPELGKVYNNSFHKLCSRLKRRYRFC